jgi:hypothetical protein
MFYSPPYLTLSILEPLTMYQTSIMEHGPFSDEKKRLKAERLMQLLYVCYGKMIKATYKSHRPA